MSFPRYPKYKDSGVEWLGEVPEHWVNRPLKRLSRIRYGIGEPPAYHPEGTPLIRATNVHNGHIDPTGVVYVNPDEIPSQRILWLDAGDIIVVRSGAYTGDSATVPAGFGPCIAGFDMVLKCHGANPAFIQYALLSCYMKDGQIALQRMRAAQPHLNAEELGQCVVTMPEFPEQAAIAAFLDRETAKIDALIAEQQRLIELLQEKRQAVISHAVTKGLNPDVPMKDSGVAWLGRIPRHWGVVQSRRLFALRNERACAGDQQLTASQDHGVIYQEDFIRLEGRRVVEVIKGSDILKHVEPQDFVISMRSFQGGIEWCRLRGSISSAYVMLIPRADLHCPFFAHLFKSRSYIQALQSTSNLVRDGQALRYANFALVALPDIPQEEQVSIAAYLDADISEMDSLVAEAERAITLLQERRSALISAAVTGQIDVRSLAGSEAA